MFHTYNYEERWTFQEHFHMISMNNILQNFPMIEQIQSGKSQIATFRLNLGLKKCTKTIPDLAHYYSAIQQNVCKKCNDFLNSNNSTNSHIIGFNAIVSTSLMSNTLEMFCRYF